jgi:hypothetical protein
MLSRNVSEKDYTQCTYASHKKICPDTWDFHIIERQCGTLGFSYQPELHVRHCKTGVCWLRDVLVSSLSMHAASSDLLMSV